MEGLATCYIAIWQDRHCDTTAYVFTDPMSAIEWARARVKEYDREGGATENLNSAMVCDDWIFNCCYSCEGDSIHIVKRKIDQEVYA